MGARILVVDDEPDLSLLIQQRFRKQIKEDKFQFLFARDGVEALETLKGDESVDIVLTDINMPRMDGLTLLSQINDTFPMLKSVIVSAYGDMKNIRTALNRGAFDFITKPIDFEDLEITINKTLKEVNQLRQALQDRDRIVLMDRELEIARNIQQSMLPNHFPADPKLGYLVAARMNPAREVGGDFYDFYPLDNETIAITIGDVSGKGVPAALFMGVSRTLLKTIAPGVSSPGDCITRVNNLLQKESTASVFVTLIYAVLNIKNGELMYTSGGHNPFYLVGADGSVRKPKPNSGIPVSFIPDFQYETTILQLQPGETIFLYTDGVTEAMDADENEYSEERLEKCLAGVRPNSPSNLINNVFDDIHRFTGGNAQSDDITVIAVQYKP
jgi:sigma-B regulation protein RsbU (phosphoserine phosphatase)